MFGKSKDENDREPHPVLQLQRPAAMHSGDQESNDQASSISRGMTVVGKISGATEYKYSATSRASFGRSPF